MSLPDQPTNQLKQYKDFTTYTNLRKAAQDIISPLIRKIEQQMTAVLQQNQQVGRKMTKLEQIFKNQAKIEKRAEQVQKAIHTFKNDVENKTKNEQRRFNKLDNINQKLFIEMHSMKTKMDGQQQIIQQINNKNTKINQMYESLASQNEKTIKQLQSKYSLFTTDVLHMEQNIKNQHQKIQSEIKVLHQTFRMQREAYEEKAKPLQLFLSERQLVSDRFQDLESKLMANVTKDDFQGYRKSNKLQFDKSQKQTQHKIQKILPLSLRKLLPSIQASLKEVDKIKDMEKQNQERQKQMHQLARKIKQENIAFTTKIQKLKNEIQAQSDAIKEKLSYSIQDLQKKQIDISEKIQSRISIFRNELEAKVEKIIQNQELKAQKSKLVQVNGVQQKGITQSQAEKIMKDIEQFRDIFAKLSQKFIYFKQIAEAIDYKIQDYASKITKIKSDFELFSDNIRKQMSGVIKFRDSFLERLKDIGSMLSTFAEAILVNASITVQNMQQQSPQMHGQPRQTLVFTTQNDGIVYEWKPENKYGVIQYRKQRLEYRQFVLSYMYSLVSFLDSQFANMGFLNWQQHKPSRFFYDELLINYKNTTIRKIESRKSHRENKSRKSSTHLGTNDLSYHATIANQNIVDLQSTKQFFRTIDPSQIASKQVQESKNDFKRNFSVKRQNLVSGKARGKDKTIDEMNRYDKIFLTSRSACRSRISQAF